MSISGQDIPATSLRRWPVSASSLITTPKSPAPSQAGHAQPRPLIDRQIVELLKAAQQRACRLHAD